jgi:hypothetical protein
MILTEKVLDGNTTTRKKTIAPLTLSLFFLPISSVDISNNGINFDAPEP